MNKVLSLCRTKLLRHPGLEKDEKEMFNQLFLSVIKALRTFLSLEEWNELIG